MSFQKILIAVDDSQFAAEAANVGIELAKSLDAAVGFVNVIDPSSGNNDSWGFPEDRKEEMSEQAGRRLVTSFLNRTATRSKSREWVKAGAPASKIIEVAKEWHADLVVMGSHGRGKIAGLLLGSVSQAVLHHAPCPVLVVRPQT